MNTMKSELKATILNTISISRALIDPSAPRELALILRVDEPGWDRDRLLRCEWPETDPMIVRLTAATGVTNPERAIGALRSMPVNVQGARRGKFFEVIDVSPVPMRLADRTARWVRVETSVVAEPTSSDHEQPEP